MTTGPPRVFVIDDDESVARGLARLLTAAGCDVSTFTSAVAFLDHGFVQLDPACLILDQRMPELTGLELQKVLRAAGGTMSVVFLTGHGDVPTTVQAMREGAIDVLVKPVEEERLIEAVHRGFERSARACQARREQDDFLARLARLTPRERQVAALVVRGYLNKQIAQELGTAERTVKIHRSRVMHKLGVNSVAELVRIGERTQTLGFDAA
jgi:FixJ family two-component response regulator